MSTNADRVRAAFEAWGQGSSRELFALVDPEVTWRVIGTTPISGTQHGKKQFLAATQPFVERLADPITARVLAIHEAGDTVIVQWEGTSRGRNGRPYDQSYCWVMRSTGDTITDEVAYLDTALINDMFAG